MKIYIKNREKFTEFCVNFHKPVLLYSYNRNFISYFYNTKEFFMKSMKTVSRIAAVLLVLFMAFPLAAAEKHNPLIGHMYLLLADGDRITLSFTDKTVAFSDMEYKDDSETFTYSVDSEACMGIMYEDEKPSFVFTYAENGSFIEIVASINRGFEGQKLWRMK